MEALGLAERKVCQAKAGAQLHEARGLTLWVLRLWRGGGAGCARPEASESRGVRRACARASVPCVRASESDGSCRCGFVARQAQCGCEAWVWVVRPWLCQFRMLQERWFTAHCPHRSRPLLQHETDTTWVGLLRFVKLTLPPLALLALQAEGKKIAQQGARKVVRVSPSIESSTAIRNELGRVEASDEAYCGAHSG